MTTRERPKRSEVQTPGNTPTRKQRSISPSVAKIKIEGRRVPGNIYVPRKKGPPKGNVPEGVKSLTAPGFAGNTVAGAANVVELARALRNDVDLIFEFVYNNIEFIPTYGSQKGAYGTLIDGFGNAFDQSELMIELLREAGYTCSFQHGELELTEAETAAWLGNDVTSIWAASNLLGNCGVPNETHWTGTEWKLRVAHCWVKVTIDTTDYVFDPAMKAYNVISSTIDLETALDYDRTDFMNDATNGATITSDYVLDMNRTNVRNNLAALTGNLVDYLKTNAPAATLTDILGGREIVPVTAPVRLTSLPYLRPSTTPTTWTDIPNAYKCTLGVLYDDPNIDVTFYSKDIHGKRLTLTFNASHECELRLDGDLVATSDAQIPDSWNSVLLSITHPTADPWWDQSFWQTVYEGFPYLICQGWGNAGRQMAEIHRQKLKQARFDGGAPSDEEVIGEALAVRFSIWNAQKSWTCNVFNRMTNCTTVLQHQVGLVGHVDTPVMDLGGILWSSGALDNNYDNVNTNDTALAMHGIAFEAGTIEQVAGIGGISTTTIIDKAVQEGLKIYDGNSANWSSTVRPALSNYDSGALDDIENWYINWDWRVAIPEDGQVSINDFLGMGYYAISPWYGAIGIISGYLQGGGGDEPQDQNDNEDETEDNETDPDEDDENDDDESKEPVNLVTGSYNYLVSDITVGSGKQPYTLAFERSYTSNKRLSEGPLGLGWTHNWNVRVDKNSDGLLSMATKSPMSGSAGLVAMFVTVDLYRDLGKPMDKWVAVAMTNRWLLDQSRNNTAIISFPGDTQVFVRLPDGSYVPPLRRTGNLVQNGGGDWTYTDKHQVVTNFNSDGQITEIVYPYGVTITCTYTLGKLTSVSNSMGRELTLSYDGDVLISVSDGERTVEYALDVDGNLETVTDTEANDTDYVYDIPGRLTQIFQPAFPVNAIVTNTYDTLDRVMSQSNGASNTWTFYLAGSRSEEEDPAGNSHVLYLDRNGRAVKDIDALGNETVKQYDGLSRLVSVTFPEGNKREFTYDQMNNILSMTDVAKPGSSLADIVRTFTYDETWNRIHTLQDGRLNTTTYTYDEESGQLLFIEYPEVDGVVATVSMTYNGRGQILSLIDQCGMQTQFTYDGTTEGLTSKIVNTNWTATIGGSATVADVLTIIVTDAGIGGGSKAKNYTVQSGDTLEDIAQGLTDVINSDSELTGLGITAKAISEVLSLSCSPGSSTSFTESISGGATETITVAAGLNLLTAFEQDEAGNVNNMVDARGNTTGYQWDNMRRLKAITPDAPFSDYQTKVSYDENGNRIKVEHFAGLDNEDEPIWQTFEWTFTVDNKVESKSDPTSNVSTFAYNNIGKLWKFEDAAERITELLYDENARIQSVIAPMNVTAQQRTYSDNGKLSTIEDANGNVTVFERDDFDRLKKQTFADSTFEQFTRDENGNVIEKLTRAADTITYVFDELNRLREKEPDNLPVVSYDYDLCNRLRHIGTPQVGGNPASGEFDFGYDSAGRLVSEKAPDGKLVSYEVDENGNVTKLTYPDGYYVDRAFDELNRLTGIKLNGAGSNALTFGWDPLSRRTALDYDNTVSCAYGYENLDGDITSITQTFDGSSVAFSYGFNSVHEVMSQGVDDSAYLWHPDAATTVAYDPANELNQIPEIDSVLFDYNDNGCLISDGVWDFGYDTENRLVTADDGVTNAGYLYDPFNRQTQKEVDSSKTRFVYSGWQRIADYNGSDVLVNRYVYGSHLDEPLIKVAAGGGLTYLHHDRLGSIVALSDELGTVTGSYNYSPWGESANMTGTDIGFTGQRYDAETGLYYFKNRHYSPRLGRFLQPDPLGYRPGPLNLYQYASNNPLSFTDPLGLEDVFDADNTPTQPSTNQDVNSMPDSDPALSGQVEAWGNGENVSPETINGQETGNYTVTVQPGDTLWDLAEQLFGDPTRWPELYDANRDIIGNDPDLIYPGQKLRIPNDKP